MELKNLYTMHMDSPLGFDRCPYFSWEIKSDENDVVQTAYQILVSHEGNVLWDSSKVESDQATYLMYDGAPLQSRNRCKWTVTAWDNHGNTAHASSYFEMALLHESDWKGMWMETPFPSKKRGMGFGLQPPATMFRRDFGVQKQLMHARLYATSHGAYLPTINGQRVDDRTLAPEHTVYGKYLCYQTYDVTAHLREGDNAIGFYVGDGWYCCPHTKPDIKRFKPVHAILFQLELCYVDGSRELVFSDQSVTCDTGAVVSSDLFAGELYDATLEQAGWDCAEFDASLWKPAKMGNYSLDNLRAQFGEPVRPVMELPVQTMYKSPKGETILDFGQVIAGRLRIEVNVPQNAKITLDHFEVPDKDGNYFNNIMTKMVGKGCDQRDVYISNGSPSVYEPLFTYHGFRYVRVEGVETIQAKDVTAIVLSSDKRDVGTFECSNPLINRLYENTRWSQRGNMLSIPTDCPQREKAGWTGDIQIYATTSLLNEDTTTFLTRWLENVSCDQKENGAVPYVVPNVGSYINLFKMMGVANKGLPASAGWGDAAVIVPYSMYKTTGNTAILEQQYESMKLWCDYVIHAAKKGRGKTKTIPQEVDQYLWNAGFHYGEWLIPSLSKNGVGKETYASMKTTMTYTAPIFGYYSVSSMAKAAKALGRQEDHDYFSDIADKMANAIKGGLIDDNGNMPMDYMGAYVLPIYFDLVPEKHKEYFAAKLITMIQNNGNCLDTGFLGTPFLLDALCKIGRRDKAYELLYQKKSPSWLYEVEHGATTIWESWYGYEDDGSPIPISMNHYTFGCIDDWIFRNINGIDKNDAGFKKILIHPQPDESLQFANRTYHTPHGAVSCNWKKEGNQFVLDVVIPCNTTATVIMPDGESKEVGSGRYAFTCAV